MGTRKRVTVSLDSVRPGCQLAVSASRRAAARSYLELKRGLDSLATVSSTAALLGLALTARGVVISFGGAGASAATIKASVFHGLSEALLPCAFGLALSLFALLVHHVLETQLRTFEVEMEHRPAQLFALIPR